MLILISMIIYISYNVIAISKSDNIPTCLSDTYYLFPKWVFPLVMILVSGLLLPVWLDLLNGSDFQFLAFLICIGIMFIGFSPDYKNDKFEYKIHSICTYIASLLTLIAITIVMGYWYLLIGGILISFATFYLLEGKDIKHCWLYLIEHALFLSVYVSLIFEL